MIICYPYQINKTATPHPMHGTLWSSASETGDMAMGRKEKRAPFLGEGSASRTAQVAYSIDIVQDDQIVRKIAYKRLSRIRRGTAGRFRPKEQIRDPDTHGVSCLYALSARFPRPVD
jgi:hypothetical protein